MILYINGSPKIKYSNSEYFINKIKSDGSIKYLYSDNFVDIVNSLIQIDTIIFSFPLYVDAPPSKVIEFMEYIINNNISLKDKNIYVICNCGFLESKHNNIAIDIIKNFCDNNEANFKGFLKIGAGEIIGKCNKSILYEFISIFFELKIKKFKRYLNNKKNIYLDTTIRPVPKWLYVIIANIYWRKKMINNNCLKEDN